MSDNILLAITERIAPRLAVILIAITAVGTSSVAGIKLIQETPSLIHASPQTVNFASPINDDQDQAGERGNDENSRENEATESAAPNNASESLITPIITRNPLPTPTFMIASGSLQANSQTNTNQCIITLFGNRYDVTSLRKTHSGGDIFKCGTDMTTVYQGRHGTNLARMQPYLLTGGSGSTGSTSSGGQGINNSLTPTPTSVTGRENEEEAEENEERRRSVENNGGTQERHDSERED